MQKDILFFWVQGCGKWTQANIFLQNNPNYKYFEAWNIFRALSSNKNIFSDYVSSRIQAWLLVEDKLVFWLFNCGTNLLNEWEFMLLDGFPRNLDQKNYFTQQWNKIWRDYVCVNFDYSETLPVIQAFESEWKVITINADQSIEDIQNELISKLNLF